METIIEGKVLKVENIIDKLLYENPSDQPGTGTIKQDAYSCYNGSSNCLMTEKEWVDVLLAIEADPQLCALKIHNVEDGGTEGFRAATFISDDTQENVIIFRGTFTAQEWVDDGQGGYQEQTQDQYRALKYVNQLDIVNSYSFITSGHSKGGNLAQYVALFATDTPNDTPYL